MPNDIHLVNGTILQAIRDTEVTGLVHWRAPMTSGFEGVVPAGTLVEALQDPRPHATATYFRPLKYEELESTLIPERDRTADKYDGYTIVLRHAALGDSWLQVRAPSSSPP
jgi:hypothetical protein